MGEERESIEYNAVSIRAENHKEIIKSTVRRLRNYSI